MPRERRERTDTGDPPRLVQRAAMGRPRHPAEGGGESTFAALVMKGRNAQVAGFAKLGRTTTDHTCFMGDQCQSFVASLCLDPMKLI